MANDYLVGRVHPELLASFEELVEEGELAQLQAFAEHAIATNFHGGLFESWWLHTPKRGQRSALTGSDTYRDNDHYLLSMLRHARAFRDVLRRCGQQLIDSSDVTCAWRYVRHAFMTATYG
jgi:hypothetical protein